MKNTLSYPRKIEMWYSLNSKTTLLGETHKWLEQNIIRLEWDSPSYNSLRGVAAATGMSGN